MTSNIYEVQQYMRSIKYDMTYISLYYSVVQTHAEKCTLSPTHENFTDQWYMHVPHVSDSFLEKYTVPPRHQFTKHGRAERPQPLLKP